MKKIKKIMALVVAMVTVLVMGVTASAATQTPATLSNGTASITVTLPTLPTGYTGTDTYKIYKVFDATNDGASTSISYSLVSGKTTVPTGFILDDAGNIYLGTTSVISTGAANEVAAKVSGSTVYITPQTTELTPTQIDAIKSYVSDSDLVATVTTTQADTSFTVTGLAYGYYYITTTTGTLVTVDSTNPIANVDDKNTVPTLTKKITSVDAGSVDTTGVNAIAQVGTDVDYEVTIKVGKGAMGYVFHDKMDAGLSYNNDISIKIGTATVDAANYSTAITGDDTIAVTFTNNYLATLAENTEITITYSAKVTSDALTTTPANNTAYLNYGDNNKTENKITHVYNAKFTVTKTDGKGEALAGAGFVLKNADNKYYKFTAATDTTAATVSWVDSIDNATELITTTTTGGNIITFTGLSDGTYTLVEKTVPAGYNPAADSQFTVNAVTETDALTSTNLEQGTTVVNNSGAELPSTGGMGTTIFYLVGAVLVLGASVLLVTRRRMSAK